MGSEGGKLGDKKEEGQTLKVGWGALEPYFDFRFGRDRSH